MPPSPFLNHYGRRPTVRAEAPGRINLIGEHIDYLGGIVLPVAIDRHIQIEAAPSEDGCFEILPFTDVGSQAVRFSAGEMASDGGGFDSWMKYVHGVIAVYREIGIEAPPFVATLTSTLPVGAGLSSSAALEMVVALAIESISGKSVEKKERALLCQKAEHEYAGVPCGIMDQFAVAFGKEKHAIAVDCEAETVALHRIPEELAIVVADTGVKHALADGEYRQRRTECEEALGILGVSTFREVTLEKLERKQSQLGDILYRRSRHVITEMRRVETCIRCLASGELDELYATMFAGHDSLRDDFEVSCLELDILVEVARDFGSKFGPIGARMTGGGFGGSVIALVSREKAEQLKEHLSLAYFQKFRQHPEVFVTRPVDGARVVSI